MEQYLKISDLDCIYLTYDEPQKETFWAQIKNMVPWAKRVDGVKGSDAAHKAAAATSTTERFVLIDGDNLPDAEFFSETLRLDNGNKDCVFRWKARNCINGLTYGNGGISCWTREFVNNMKTHENTDGSTETAVEFCFDRRYLAMHNCYSTTYPNGSKFQAWRAGFREGVKMCLDRGRRVSIREFNAMRMHQNFETLSVWHNVGADVQNGDWSMYGARLGTWMVMLDSNWDYTEVQNFDSLSHIFKSVNEKDLEGRKIHYNLISNEIVSKLELSIVNYNSNQSRFWKKFYSQIHRNKNIMDIS